MGKLLFALEKHLCALCPPALSTLHCSGTPTFPAAPGMRIEEMSCTIEGVGRDI